MITETEKMIVKALAIKEDANLGKVFGKQIKEYPVNMGIKFSAEFERMFRWDFEKWVVYTFDTGNGHCEVINFQKRG